MKIKIKPWKIKIKRKKQPHGYKKVVEEKMKDRKNIQRIQGGRVLFLAVLLGVSSFVTDQQMCAYAGITESEPEVSVIAETYAESEASESFENIQPEKVENSEIVECT